MNRTELIDAVSRDSGLTRVQSEAALDAVVYEITNGVRSGSPVRVTGFGTFKLRQRQARTGRNPRTGTTIQSPAKTVPAFTAGKAFKETVQTGAAAEGDSHNLVAYQPTTFWGV